MRKLFALVALALGCVPAAEKIALSADVRATRDEVLRVVPKGTALAEAERKMRRNGFECSVKSGEAWVGVEGKRDYLYCDRERSGFSLVSRRWQVAIFLEKESVTEVDVQTGLIGP